MVGIIPVYTNQNLIKLPLVGIENLRTVTFKFFDGYYISCCTFQEGWLLSFSDLLFICWSH